MPKKFTRKSVTKLDQFPVSPIDAVLKKLDLVAAELETLWGAGVLQNLATPDTVARWLRVKVALDDAITGGDYDTIKAKSESLIRGWQKLEAEAIDAGHDQGKMRDRVWLVCSPEAEG